MVMGVLFENLEPFVMVLEIVIQPKKEGKVTNVASDI